MKTIAEQIRDLENTRAAKAARMEEVAQKAADRGESMDDAEGEEVDTLNGEIEKIDKDLVRLRRIEQLKGQAAKPANPTTVKTPASGSEARGTGPAIIINRTPEEKFKGQFFTQMVIARAVARLNQCSAIDVAQVRWGKSNPMLVEVIKAGVAGGGTGAGEWGAELVQADARYTGDFIEYLHGQTLFDQLPLREVPANVTIKGQDGAATGYWVGESKGIPVSKPDFSTVSLTPLKVAALAVVSNDLLRYSSPSAEQLVRDALVKASAQRIDATFFSTTAASAGVSPAGILNGLVAIASSGTDLDSVLTDIMNLYAPFITALNASDLVLATNKTIAKAMQLMVNPLGQRAFPEASQNGGTIAGDKLYTSDNVPANHLALIKPSDIYKIGDTGVEISLSGEATLEQDSAPQGATDTPVAASANLTSMFQEDSTAIRVIRHINFAKRRTSAVAYIDDAAYTPFLPSGQSS